MKYGDRFFLPAVVIIALLLRLYRIDGQSLWVDELLTLNVSIPEPGLHIWDYLKYNIHGPLHALVIYFFQLVSRHDGWLRLPSALAGAASVLYLYRWIDVWLGRGPARLATVFLSVHPLHIYYSQELRNYSFLVFFATFSSYHFHRLLAAERSRRFVTYVVGMTAAALSNFSAAFLYVVHTVIFVSGGDRTRPRVLRWAIVTAVLLALLSPWIYRIYTFIDFSELIKPVLPGELSAGDRLRGETTVTLSAIPYTFYAFSAGFSLGPSLRELHQAATIRSVLTSHPAAVLWVLILFGGLLVRGAYAALLGSRRPFEIFLYLAGPLLFTLALSWQNAKVFNVRYVILSLPAFLCLLAVAVLSLPAWRRRLAVILVVVTMLLSTGRYYFDGRYAREDVRSACRDLDQMYGEEDCILAPTVREVVEHYCADGARVRSLYTAGISREELTLRLDDAIGDCDTVWYVRAREWVHDPQGYVLEELELRYHRSETRRYDGVTVVRYDR